MTMMVILLPCRSLLLLSLTVCKWSPLVNHLPLASSLFCKLSVVDVRDDLQPNILSHAPPTHLNKLILQNPSRSSVVAEWESRRVMSTANFSADEKQITLIVLVRFNCSAWNSRPLDIYFGFKHFSVHYCSSWKCFDHSWSSQRVFTSSAVQALASLPSNN